VVWFGEALPEDTLEEIGEFIDQGKIDLIMVIGTTAKMYPAAGYVSVARARGARVAVINMEVDDLGATDTLGFVHFLYLSDPLAVRVARHFSDSLRANFPLPGDAFSQSLTRCRPDDFLFKGDAAKILPEILKSVIGELPA